MSVVFGAILPHPPIVLPEIGRERLADCQPTVAALKIVAAQLKEVDPEVIVIYTPHGEVAADRVNVYTREEFSGNFSYFGVPRLTINFAGEPNLGKAIVNAARGKKIAAAEIEESFLDHGILVPLYYPKAAGVKPPIVPVAIAFMPLTDLYEFGAGVAEAVGSYGKRAAIIASADMSHRLTPDAPAGYHPDGEKFDRQLVDIVKKNDVKALLDFDLELADRAGQDALWSIAMLWGALKGLTVKSDLLSYEGPFGVGYMVARYEPR